MDIDDEKEEASIGIPGVLAVDVGNTSVHIAAVQGETVSEVRVLRDQELSGLDEVLRQFWETLPQQRKVVAASVNAAYLAMLEASAKSALKQEVLLVGRDVPLPIKTDLPQPERIGTDRLCAAVAAYDRIGTACVVADFGTAITIDCVSDEGVFLGGAIMPGLRMGAQSLHDGTDQLPLVELVDPTWVFGKDTRQAIVGGLIVGARGALRELVERYANYLNHWPTVVITGGDAPLICPDPRNDELVQAIVPDLALRGVAAAWYRTLLK